MTRNGKIARLPLLIREKVNVRLHNGEEAGPIAEWLNALPETRRILSAEFDGQPVNENNISNWKLGGYQDWLARQESLDAVRALGADAAELRKAGAAQLTDQLALCLAARIAIAVQRCENKDDPAGEADRLPQLCAELVELRKGDHEAQWLDLERKKWEHKTAAEKKLARKQNQPRRRPMSRETFDRLSKELNLM